MPRDQQAAVAGSAANGLLGANLRHPRPQPRTGDHETHSSKPGRGLGQEGHPPGIFHWTTDSAEVLEQVEFLTTKRLLTLERLMWERDPSP